MKIALLTRRPDIRPELWSRMCACPGIAETCVMQSRLGSLAHLLFYRPDVVVCSDFGTAAVQASVYRSLSPQSRLLLCATDAPQRLGSRGRAVLDRVDAVLAEGDTVAHAMEQVAGLAGRVFSVAMPFEVEGFLACGQSRPLPQAHRLIHVGDLSPQSGAADLLTCVAARAEQQPDRPIEVWWTGEGDLAGVLAAQPLPRNASQRFIGHLDTAAMPGAFGKCGVMVVPPLADDWRALIAHGMAAGLPVLGSNRSRAVRQFVREGVTGWLFDPLHPGDMARVLNRILDTPVEQLDGMRDNARALVRPLAPQEFTDQLSRVIAAIMPGPARDPSARRGLRQPARPTAQAR